MEDVLRFKRIISCIICSLMAFLIIPMSLCACGTANAGGDISEQDQNTDVDTDVSRYLSAIEDEPDTVDFQCTSIYYTIAQNVFDRLVEAENDDESNIVIIPSLADSWEVSEDGTTYVFHLRDNVTFSNGSPLTASDVLYTFTRLLTHPDSCNQDIAEVIKGAVKLENGEARELEGFSILSDLDFSITLEEPFEAFLACLSMPGASILDEETTEAAGERFGKEAGCTIGTGSFILTEWNPGEGMLLEANRECWNGAPKCDGLDLKFLTDPETEMRMFDNGEIDVLDLDELGDSAELYMQGDIYRDRMEQVQQIGITYIALNETVKPLDDVRVRKALQMALNRNVMLDAVYSGRGSVENGIFPHGLYGFNPDLPEIPYDPDGARELLKEAGLSDGFELPFSVKNSSTQREMDLVNTAADMWEKIGVRTDISVIDESEFMAQRKNGQLACYTATWTADYDDPDNFIYTFFGNRDNTTFRSLCYQDESVMDRVRLARTITDPEVRIQEYRDLEQKIIQEDAAWIPLFSRLRYYTLSERTSGFRVSWNGSVKNNYRHMSVS